MIPVRIAGTSALRPGRAVPTAELAARLDPPRAAAEVERKTGIRSRYVIDPGTTAAELGAEALDAALARAGIAASSLRRIMFVDSLGGDMLIPATANGIAKALGLTGTCDCVDLNNACMGFLSAFDLAARCVATGHGPVGIAVVELGSRYVTPREPRPFLVLGDGVAATVLAPAWDGEGILGSVLGNNPAVDGGVRFAHGNLTGTPEIIRFGASNAQMSELALGCLRESTAAVLGECGLSLGDVQWVLPHQPNGTLLEAVITQLGLDRARVVPVVDEVGSVGAASIPISLDRLARSGRLCPRDVILMVGVGAGLAYGAILVRIGA